MTFAELYDRALSLIGEREVRSEQQVDHDINLWVKQVAGEALMVGAWSFARKLAALKPAADGGYLLPDDCLRVLRRQADRFDVVGRKVYVPSSARVELDSDGCLPCLYVSSEMADSGVLPDYAPLFLYGLELLLASKIAMVTTGRAAAAASYAQAGDAALRRALHFDMVQLDSNDQRPALGHEREGAPWGR